VNITDEKEIKVGSRITVKAEVRLGELGEDDVQVELYFSNLDKKGDIVDGVALPMTPGGSIESGAHEFTGQMLCLQSGQFGFTVRVIPHNRVMARKFDPDLKVTWA
jgi:starch phosphorylase